MNTRISTTTREEGGVDNERIPPHIDKVPIVVLEDENKEVHLQEPKVPPKPQEAHVPQVPPMPQATFVEGDMTNAELRYSLMYMT